MKYGFVLKWFNAAQLFIFSFFGVIFLGALLLKLPNATVGELSFLDALFTSTSAVCVTGLIVVDTATHFTLFGQTIILILIQIGGLGILTFASYFSYFFKGNSSYEEQLVLSNMNISNKIGEVLKTLKYIILITLSVEFLSALGIYFSVQASAFTSSFDRLFFSVFHAVSAFCNAGFSILSDGLADVNFQFKYGFQIIIILTFVLGGMGFPIVSNILAFLKYHLYKLLKFNKRKQTYKPWVLNINSRITLITTFSILTVATFVFYVLEFNGVLSSHNGFGKLITALFGATTPRTAGFNTFNFSDLQFPTLMMIILLMWIGASPQSTGGGIKTSTFAIATMNIISLARGKQRIEIFRREIADSSVRRAFATISLSLIVIGLAVIIISYLEPHLALLEIAFECFSAYSTVGLSLGITAGLSDASKFLLIFVMFVGRISMLTLLVAFINKVKQKSYRYPNEEIVIN